MIKIIKDNIVNLSVDAIVNAANNSLMGGGGVDGAIHKAAGAKLYSACEKIGYCKTGKAVITPGFDLKAKYIIHTVGPIYNSNRIKECEEQLRSCYISSLDLAKQNDIHSIAFPCISAGVYGYPIKDSCKIAINTVYKWLNDNNDYKIETIFVCFLDNEYEIYKKEILNYE